MERDPVHLRVWREQLVPTWGEILNEIERSAVDRDGPPDLDGVRRKYLNALHEQTGRSVILYASDWLTPGDSWKKMINLEDIQGLMGVCKGIGETGLDVILHSPGGSAEAVEDLVTQPTQLPYPARPS